jgi:hypothetical protein
MYRALDDRDTYYVQFAARPSDTETTAARYVLMLAYYVLVCAKLGANLELLRISTDSASAYRRSSQYGDAINRDVRIKIVININKTYTYASPIPISTKSATLSTTMTPQISTAKPAVSQ